MRLMGALMHSCLPGALVLGEGRREGPGVQGVLLEVTFRFATETWHCLLVPLFRLLQLPFCCRSTSGGCPQPSGAPQRSVCGGCGRRRRT